MTLHNVRHVNPYPTNLIYLNFHPLKIVARYSDPQLQVGENYSYLFNYETKHLQIQMFKLRNLNPNHSLIKEMKNDNSRDQQAKV